MWHSLLGEVLHLLLRYWLVIGLVAAVYFYWRGTRGFDYWSKRGVPAWVPSPLLYRRYFTKYGNVVGTYFGKKPVLLIADPAVIKRILTTDFHLVRNRPESSAGHRIFGQNVVAAKGEAWKRIRSILNPMFSPLKLKRMEPMMEDCVRSMMTFLEREVKNGDNKNYSLDVRNTMGNFTIDVIAKCAFATDTNAHNSTSSNPFVTNAKNFFAFRPARFIAMSLLPKFVQKFLVKNKLPPLNIEEYDFFEAATKHMIEKRKEEIQQGRSNHHHDLLQLMLKAEEDKELELASQREFREIIGTKYLTEEEVQAQAMVFYLAGYESTANTLSHLLYLLALHPQVQRKLFQELQQAKEEFRKPLTFTELQKLPYLDAVVSETLRLYCPALQVPREAGVDYPIPEYNLVVEKGTFIMLDIFHNHTSEKYWPQAEKFDPERFMGENREKIVPYTFLPFSSGPRQCIGMRLSLMETKLGVARILDRYEVVRTAKTTDRLTIKQGAFLLKTSPIWVGLVPRSG
ncbi:hypothetical protein TYRP_019771 [Tyrophagus putrescentiae]|nr:hypothetical protein TYRP_019771 [Tyrophagus putrescentiae]